MRAAICLSELTYMVKLEIHAVITHTLVEQLEFAIGMCNTEVVIFISVRDECGRYTVKAFHVQAEIPLGTQPLLAIVAIAARDGDVTVLILVEHENW